MMSKICRISGWGDWISVEYYDINDESTWNRERKSFKGMDAAILWCDFSGYTILDTASFEASLGLRYNKEQWNQYSSTLTTRIQRERRFLLFGLRVY